MWKDLAPSIYRQRLVIEGKPKIRIGSREIGRYLSGLSKVLGMKALIKPVTNRSIIYGWSGWIHWETSGAHFYSWDAPVGFFSCDIYACKRFGVAKAVKYTKEFFKADVITFKQF